MNITKPSIMLTLEETGIELENTVTSEEFIEKARGFKAAFTRIRKLSLIVLVFFMLNLVKSTTKVALDRFQDKLDVKLDITQQAFSKARQKLNPEAIRLIIDNITKKVYQKGFRTWHGYRILAIDGSKIQLPSDKKLKKIFGTYGGSDAAVTAQCSTLFDVLNGIFLDVRMGPISNGERSLAALHLEFLKKVFPDFEDLVLLDRGYPSIELFRLFDSLSKIFIMRIKSKFNVYIDALPLGCHNLKLRQNGEEIKLRIIKFKLPTGETETLVTNLFDYNLGQKHFMELYSLRWGVEVRYNTLKHGLEIENFSSRTEGGIYQDFYVAALFHNIVTIGSWEAQEIIDENDKTKTKKYEYKVNLNQAVGAFKDRFIEALFESDPERRAEKLRTIINKLVKAVSPIRPNRSVPRNPNPRKANFYHNKKSNC
jgi:hypothetical protein